MTDPAKPSPETSTPVEADDSVRVLRLLATIPDAKVTALERQQLLAIADELEQSRAELAAIKAAAEDSTEYVLAQVNRELRAEIARLRTEIDALDNDVQKEGEALAAVTEQCAAKDVELAEARADIANDDKIMDAMTAHIAKLTALVRGLLTEHAHFCDRVNTPCTRCEAEREAVKP